MLALKVDLVKQLAGYRATRGRFDVVAVPPLRYLMVDGHGEGLRVTGEHHEIYLDDSRRTDPDRLRTILRRPVTRDAPPTGRGPA